MFAYRGPQHLRAGIVGIVLTGSSFAAVPLGAQLLPTLVLASRDAVGAPDVAAEGSNVYVVFQVIEGGKSVVKFQRSTDEGATFGPEKKLSAAGAAASLPRIAAAGEDVYVVWQETSLVSTVPQIVLRRSVDGGETFEPGGEALSLEDVVSTLPAVAVAGPMVYVTWQERIVHGTTVADRHQIVFRRSLFQGRLFQDLQRLSDPALDSIEPAVAGSGSAVYVAWQGETSPGSARHVQLVRDLAEGVAFSDPPLDLSPGGGSTAASHPAVAAAGTLVYATWAAKDPAGEQRVSFAFSGDQAASFTDESNVGATPGRPASWPRVAAAGSSFRFVWREDESAGGGGRIRYRAPFATSDSTIELDARPPADLSALAVGSRPAVALAGSRLYAVWEENPPGEDARIVLRASRGNTGLAPTNLSASPGRFSGEATNAVVGGDVYVVWTEDVGGQLDVMLSASLDGGTGLSMPVNVSQTTGISTTPRVAAAGQAVFVVWTDDTDSRGTADIYFRRSLDRGRRWDEPAVNLSVFPGEARAASRAPTIAAEGSEVYVAWEDETVGGCRRVYGRRSEEQGAPSPSAWDPSRDLEPRYLAPFPCLAPCGQCSAFTPSLAAAGPWVHLAFKSLTEGPGQLHAGYCFDRSEELPNCQSAFNLDELLTLADDGPELAAAGSSVHAIWMHESDVRSRSRHDEGAGMWKPTLSLSLGGDPHTPTIATAGREVYAAWTDGPVVLRRSRSGAASFEDKHVVSLRGGVVTPAGPPWLGAAGPDVYLSWDEVASSENPVREAFLRASADEAATFCTAPDVFVGVLGPQEATIGDELRFEIDVGGGRCGVHGVRLFVTTSPELGRVRWCRGGGCTPVAETPPSDVVSLAPGEEITYAVSGIVDLDAVGTLEVSADAVVPDPPADAEPGDNHASAITSITVPPGTAVFCSGVEGPFGEGGTVTYLFRLHNGGPRVQGDNPGPELVDVLPAGLTLVSASADAGAVTPVGNGIEWNGAIAVGRTVTISVTAEAGERTAGTVLCNPATAHVDLDGDGVNESVRVTSACCVRVASPVEIPTLGPWALTALSALLAAAALRRLARRTRRRFVNRD